MEVVLDHALAEGRARRLRAVELGDRLAERLRHLRQRRVLVGVALVELRRLEPGRDAVETRGDGRGEGEIGVRVGAGDAVLHAEAAPLAAETEAAGAVVPAGDDARGRERARLVALVGVHAGRVEVGELARHRELAREPLAEEGARGAERGAVPGRREERLPTALVPERRVEVEGGARRAHVVLRHERHGTAVEVRDLLGPVLVERRAVGHLERLGVAEVDLLLASAPLALRALDGDVGRLHAVADRADQRLLLRRLEDVIVLEIAGGRRQLAIALRARRLERLLEDVELELRRGLDDEPLLRRALDLAPQHPARRLLDRLALLGVHVAEHERGLGQPGDEAQGGAVGNQLHVAVAALPRGELEARQRLHLQ